MTFVLVMRIWPFLDLMKIKTGQMELFLVSLLPCYEPTLFPESSRIGDDCYSIEKLAESFVLERSNLMGQEYAFIIPQY